MLSQGHPRQVRHPRRVSHVAAAGTGGWTVSETGITATNWNVSMAEAQTLVAVLSHHMTQPTREPVPVVFQLLIMPKAGPSTRLTYT